MTLTQHLIADYLKRHGHEDTLKCFLKESQLTSVQEVEYERLEDIVNDRTAYLSHSKLIKEDELNRVDNSHLFKVWDGTTSPETGKDLGIDALVVHSSVCYDAIINGDKRDVAILTSADKAIRILDVKTQEVIKTLTGLHNNVVKCAYVISGTDLLLSCGMDGKLKVTQLSDQSSVTESQLHPRLVIDFKVLPTGVDEYLIFSIGWDSTLRAHRLKETTITALSQYKLLSNATCIQVTTFRGIPIILLTRLESSQLTYFTLQNDRLYELTRVSLNDAEFSTHSFTAMSISLSTSTLTPETRIAVGTSHIPYLRIIITQLPDIEELLSSLDTTQVAEQQLSTPTTRGLLLGNFNTLSPQDKFSQPVIAWRTDSSGIWIAGDDGVIRGIEFKDGRIVKEFQGEKQRIKCMSVLRGGGKESILACSVDKRVVYWS